MKHNGFDAAFSINVTLGANAAKGVIGLEQKVKASMRAVRDGDFMGANEDSKFRAGVGGALLDVGMETADGQLIVDSVAALASLGAFMQAAQAGLNVAPPTLPDRAGRPPLLPLMPWWHEIAAEAPK